MSNLTKSEDNTVFEQIKFLCSPYNPYNTRNTFWLVEEMFGWSKPSNYIGGSNDFKRTTHENIFSVLYPSLKQQVCFGTGKKGYKKYGSKKFIADFVDIEKKCIYEIDGDNHKNMKIAKKDFFRDRFFIKELGYKTIRFTNREVENLLMRILKNLDNDGKVFLLKKYACRFNTVERLGEK